MADNSMKNSPNQTMQHEQAKGAVSGQNDRNNDRQPTQGGFDQDRQREQGGLDSDRQEKGEKSAIGGQMGQSPEREFDEQNSDTGAR